MHHLLPVLTRGFVLPPVVCAQHGSMEPTDLEREGNLMHEDNAEQSCLAGILARLHRLRRQPQPAVEEFSARERQLVQEAALTAARAVAREAADAAARALAPHVAHELARVVLRDVTRSRGQHERDVACQRPCVPPLDSTLMRVPSDRLRQLGGHTSGAVS